MLGILLIPAFLIPGFTDYGFSCSGFYRFRPFSFRVLHIPAFHAGDFTDPGFFSFRVFSFRSSFRSTFRSSFFLVSFPDSLFLVLQIGLHPNDALFMGVKLELNHINTRMYSGFRAIKSVQVTRGANC